MEQRFWQKVIKTDSCWLWVGCVNADGYGCFSVDGLVRKAHRVSYELFVGPIPNGLQIDHLCRVRHCVNPDHLEPVTQQVNIARGFHATKDTCKNGHAFTPENTIKRKSIGQRQCRACSNAAGARYRENNVEKVKLRHRDYYKRTNGISQSI